jgi:DNA-binding CsgD family transcriptional regulator/tetratricopeptide (TPR) repeat protein
LCGRDAEVEAVLGRLAALTDGRPQTVLVQGEPGIGKSRLIAEAVDRAVHANGALQVVRAKAAQLEQNRPFGLLIDALDARSPNASPMIAAVVDAIDARAAEFEIIERCAGALEHLALQSPLICVVDDLHWADASSLRALRFATRHLIDVPVAVVGALRPHPSDPVLRQWIDSCLDGGALDVHLAPLDVAAVTELVEAVVGGRAGERLLALAAGAAGNPFYLIELLEALAADHALLTRADAVDLGDSALPADFRTAILRFLTVVSPASLDLLRVAAVLGVAFSVTDLATVTGDRPGDVIAVTEEARQAGILVEAGDRLAFRHDLLREALYQDLSESARQALHHAVAAALIATHAEPVRAAEHLLLSGPDRDPESVQFLLGAARSAVDIAVRARLLRRALDLLEPDDPQRRDVASEAVHAEAAAGRLAGAEDLVERELALNPGMEILLRMARVRMYSDHLMLDSLFAESEGLLDHPDLPPHMHAELLARRVMPLLVTVPLPEAERLAQIALSEGIASGDQVAQIMGNQTISMARSFAGRGREAVAFAEAAVRAERPTTPTASHVQLVVALLAEDRLVEADDASRIGYSRCRAKGFVPPVPLFVVFRGVRMLLAGQLDDAAADADASLAAFDDINSEHGTATARAILARVALHRGELLVAQQWLDITPPPPGLGLDWYLWVSALLALSQGDYQQALAMLIEWWDGVPQMRCYMGGHATFAPDLVRVALAVGDRARAESVADVVATTAKWSDAPSVAGASLLCRGLVDHDTALLGDAVAAYVSGPRELQTARAREDLAAALEKDLAVEELHGALAAYDRLGATSDAARVVGQLRQRGVRLGTRGRRNRPTHGWASLTPAEKRVVELAVSGLVIREIGARLFISPHTAETHLRHVYRKLGIASRLDLIVAERDRPRDAPAQT